MTHAMTRPRLGERLRRRAGGLALRAFFEGLARGTALLPAARKAIAGVDVVRDVPYRASGLDAHRLDVWRPRESHAPRPVVLYVHGGAFRILSKDTHWVMALAFARRGYAVFCINYRLAPRHRYPAAIEDVCAAWRWVLANAARFGGDPQRAIIAGESAGGNLATSLAVASSYARPEPWARAVFDEPLRPRAVAPLCGVLQVRDSARFARRRPLPLWVTDRLEEVEHGYVGRAPTPATPDLADPLLVLEQGPPDRALPPFFASVGTSDPLLDDTRRLGAALDRLGVKNDVRYYAGEPHAFQALVHRPAARRSWSDLFAFVDPLVR